MGSPYSSPLLAHCWGKEGLKLLKDLQWKGGKNIQNTSFKRFIYRECLTMYSLIQAGSWAYRVARSFISLVRLGGCGNKTTLSLRVSLFYAVLSGHWSFVLSVSLLQVVCSYVWFNRVQQGSFSFHWKMQAFIDMIKTFVLSSITIFCVMLSFIIMHKILFPMFLSTDLLCSMY